eukprot:superscaffoldBa00003198_g16365
MVIIEAYLLNVTAFKRRPNFHLILFFFCCFLAEAFDLVLRHGRNSTLAMLKSEFPSLGSGAQSSVGQLFLDMSLYILGSDSTVDHMVAVLYGRLFPLTYRRLLGGSGSSASEECVRGAWKDSGAFGPYPKLMMTRLSRSLLATRVFLQALNLGIEVVNTTDHLRPGRDCSRALLKLWYCPHCQGMLGPPACRGFCQAVMQGCLGGAAEVQPHWRSYVDGLGKLAGAMRGEQDMEAVILRLPSMIKLALKHAVNARTRLSALVSGMCGHTPQRASRSVASSPPQPPAASAARNTQPSSLDADETLAGLRREFISSLKRFSSFYSGLGEALCSREPAPANHSLCWNGQEMTDRFASPGLKRSNPGSESRSNKPPEPVISQIIDKLKHINQLPSLIEARTWENPAGIRLRDTTPRTSTYTLTHPSPTPAFSPAGREKIPAQSNLRFLPLVVNLEALVGSRCGLAMPKAQRHFRHKHTSHPSPLPQPWQRQAASGKKPQRPATEAQRELLPCHPSMEKGTARMIHGEAEEGGLFFNIITFNHFLFVPQLLRLVTVSEKRWRARSRGGGGGGGVDGWSDEGEEGFESGDCDDEDECTGVSGLGPPPRRKRLRIFAG